MAKNVYYIPEGIPNLSAIFPDIDWSQVQTWFVSIKGDDNLIFAETRTNKPGCCCEDRLRIHFINAFGEIDSINFTRSEETHESKSDGWESSLQVLFDRKIGGSRRINITSNETIEAETNCYGEDDQYWFKELFDSPLAWLEMDLPNGFLPSVERDYIPIEVSDGKFLMRKTDHRYEYLVKIKISMANSNINLR